MKVFWLKYLPRNVFRMHTVDMYMDGQVAITRTIWEQSMCVCDILVRIHTQYLVNTNHSQRTSSNSQCLMVVKKEIKTTFSMKVLIYKHTKH